MNDKKDLTRIEDLSEFLHEKDTDIDRKLEEGKLAESTLVDPPLEENLEEEQILDEEGTPDTNSVPEDSNENLPEMEFTSETPQEGDTLETPLGDDNLETPLGGDTLETPLGDGNTLPGVEESHQEHTTHEGDTQPGLSQESTEFSTNVPDTQVDQVESTAQPEEPLESTLNEMEVADEIKAEENLQKGDTLVDQEPPPVAVEPQKTQKEEPPEIPITKGDDRPPPLPETPRPSVSPAAKKDKLGDIKNFAESITFSKVERGSNPPFSIILKNIKYLEDVEDIRIILREHGLMDQKNENEIEQGLTHGSILISQISEYAAVFLAHRFRRFDVDIDMGPSEELHPSESYEHDARGLISKDNMKQNKVESVDLTKDETPSIILATSPEVEGYKILRHIDVITEHSIIEEQELEAIEENRPHELYQNLGERLKSQAMKMQGNAVIGVNYEFTPLIEESEGSPRRYKVTCSGNVVLIQNEQND